MNNSEYEKKYDDEYRSRAFQEEYDSYVKNHKPQYNNVELQNEIDDEEYAKKNYEYKENVTKNKEIRDYVDKENKEALEENEEEEEKRFGFELKMPVFERVVCKKPEDEENENLISTLVQIFFVCLLALPLLQIISYLFRIFLR